MFRSALRRERPESPEWASDNDDVEAAPAPPTTATAVANRFRSLSMLLLLASCLLAAALALLLRIRIDPTGSSAVTWAVAAMLLASRIWWDSRGQHALADASGTIGVVSLAGMSCGAIAMLELRFGFPIRDALLRAADLAMGVDGDALVELLASRLRWTFWIMAPAYNFTIPIFFVSLVLQSLRGDRVEAWRAALCFAGTLLTTCLIAAFVPAKGLGVWESPGLLAQLPEQAMRTFWPHFDEFYFGAHPVLRLQVIDGVISFPSFHAVVGFLTAAMWRKNRWTLLLAGTYLAVMLLATLPGGGHYVTDLIAGLCVWVAWFGISRIIEERAVASSAC